METHLTSLFGELFEQPGWDGFLPHLPTASLWPWSVLLFIPREQQTARSCRDKAASLVLAWLLAFPSRAESGASLPHAPPEQSWDIISKPTARGELLQLGKLGADWHARPWSKKDTSMALTPNEHSLDDAISLPQDVLITTLL